MEVEPFAFIEVCELMLRHYKPIPERLRPTDRMVAHTGYLVFARPVSTPPDFELGAAVDEETLPADG
jgi:tRNA (adenine57-N1/adenine58-N1)-methyltransferase